MDVVEPEIEVLVYRMQRPADLEIVLELNRDLLAHQGLEDREEKLHKHTVVCARCGMDAPGYITSGILAWKGRKRAAAGTGLPFVSDF
jgi:hypothetical protein